jgi:hypothetical protein
MKQLFSVTLLFAAIIELLVWTGCANSVTGPTDKTAPVIQVTSPASNATILSGKTYINFAASDDQGVKYIDVLVYDSAADTVITTASARFFYTNGTAPKIYLNLLDYWVGHKIYYYCIAYDQAGNQGNSATMKDITVTNTLLVPSAPINLVGLLIPNTKIYNLTWTDTSSYVTGYELWKKIGVTGTWTKLKNVTTDNAFNTNDNNVDTALMNLYKLRSFNGNGYSDFSNIVNSFGGGNDTTLIPPTWLSATALGSHKIYISWKNNVTDSKTVVTKFIVERKEDYASDYSWLKILPPTAVNYTDTDSNMVPERIYDYRVKIFSENDSAWSRPITASTLYKPTNLRASKSTSATNAILLQWSETGANATQTWIERKSYSQPSYVQIMILPAYTLRYVDSLLTVGETYTYRVITTDGKGVSDYSSDVTFSITQFTAPRKNSGQRTTK